MFVVVLGTILGLMHVYAWKRLVKDTTAPGRTRWALTGTPRRADGAAVRDALLPRVPGLMARPMLAWPGYVWFGLIVYLFLALLVLEPVRLALRGWVNRKPAPAADPAESPGTEPPNVPRPGQCRRRRAPRRSAWSESVWPTHSAHPICSGAGAAAPTRSGVQRISDRSWCPTSTSARWRGARTPNGSSR